MNVQWSAFQNSTYKKDVYWPHVAAKPGVPVNQLANLNIPFKLLFNKKRFNFSKKKKIKTWDFVSAI